MTTRCRICEASLDSGAQPNESQYCPVCANLLRWCRGYFAHEPSQDMERINPESTFVELGIDSLDYVNWLAEAEEKLGIPISDSQGERFITIADFLRFLRLHGADWPSGCEIQLIKKGGWFSKYSWVKIRRD